MSPHLLPAYGDDRFDGQPRRIRADDDARLASGERDATAGELLMEDERAFDMDYLMRETRLRPLSDNMRLRIASIENELMALRARLKELDPDAETRAGPQEAVPLQHRVL